MTAGVLEVLHVSQKSILCKLLKYVFPTGAPQLIVNFYSAADGQESLVAYHYSINQPLPGVTAGTYNYDVNSPTSKYLQWLFSVNHKTLVRRMEFCKNNVYDINTF